MPARKHGSPSDFALVHALPPLKSRGAIFFIVKAVVFLLALNRSAWSVKNCLERLDACRKGRCAWAPVCYGFVPTFLVEIKRFCWKKEKC